MPLPLKIPSTGRFNPNTEQGRAQLNSYVSSIPPTVEGLMIMAEMVACVPFLIAKIEELHRGLLAERLNKTIKDY